MKRFAACLIALMLPAMAFAQADPNANINYSVGPPDYAGCNAAMFSMLEAGTCEDGASAGMAGTIFKWVWVHDADGFPDGIGGAQFGIETDKPMIGWTLCTGGNEVPEGGWPASGTGNAVTWEGGCYDPPGVIAVVGFFTIADGMTGGMTIIGDPREGVAKYADCVPNGHNFCPENLMTGVNDGALTPDCDLCEGTPVQESSWGEIKSMY